MKFKILVFLWTLMALGLGMAAHARADAPDAAPVATPADPVVVSADLVAVPTDIDAAIIVAGDAYTAMRAGHVRAVIALVLILLVAALREFAGGVVPWLRTDRGGVMLVLICALLLELSAVLPLGAPLTANVLLSALLSGLTAAGGWVAVRRLIWPPDQAGVAEVPA
jgi:hypothetical protein